jgi:protein-disulfide isomerase
VAPIRIVIFSDYQCPDCKIIEQQVRQVLSKYDNVSFSAKQNPISTDCNPYTNTNMHPNACWAARVAETAGILRGNDGFWQMHHWLFNEGGSFTADKLAVILRQMGYNEAEFLRVLQSEESLVLVQADIEEAYSVGMVRTPMIFINGVELKGWMAPAALIKAVDRLATANLTPGTAGLDRPPSTFEKCILDWSQQPRKQLPADSRAWTMGPREAPVRVVLWGDLQEPFSSEADEILRGLVASRGDASYTFRHYPIDEKCNPVAPRTLHPLACLAARAAEAAGTIAGNDGYWAAHTWLFENIDRLSTETLREAADAAGVDLGSLLAEMEAPEVAAAIAEDATAGKALNLRSVPFIFVNEKLVPRWHVDGIPAAILEQAAKAAPATSR